MNFMLSILTYASFIYFIFGLNSIKYNLKYNGIIYKRHNLCHINRHTILRNQMNTQDNDQPTISSYQLDKIVSDEDTSIIRGFERTMSVFFNSNPLYRIVANLYSFFYWFPRKNLPYDQPWMLFKNSTTEWLQWNQFPHNLPPYNYLGEDHPKDFFCWGLPGNTWPLGNWDPCAMQLVSPKVVKRYRESELKHGRLAMLATTGFLIQETYHPIYASHINGLAITHMAQFRELDLEQSLIFQYLLQPICNYFQIHSIGSVINVSLDYYILISIFMMIESFILKRNWTRWARNEYNHQFDHNIGIGNLKQNYENGNYGFDPLKLLPNNSIDRKFVIEAELNHCRLAMIAAIGMIMQEYFTGLPVMTSLTQWLSMSDTLISSDLTTTTTTQEILNSSNSIFESFFNLFESIRNQINSAFEAPRSSTS